MVFKRVFNAIKSKLTSKEDQTEDKIDQQNNIKIQSPKTQTNKESQVSQIVTDYKNRHLKHYYKNKSKLLYERKSLYQEKLEANICVRCNEKAKQNKKLCTYHINKQKEYNKAWRSKKKSN